MDDDDEQAEVFNKANLDDEFLRHPDSGAFYRNPLREKSTSTPVVLSARDYRHNCLEEAMGDWQCISVSEETFREMLAGSARGDETPRLIPSAVQTPRTPRTPRNVRATVAKIRTVPQGYDYVVSLKKSSYFAPRGGERRRAEKGEKEFLSASGVNVDKLNIVVSKDDDGKKLRIDAISGSGLVADWNRAQPGFAVKPGDTVLRVNARSRDAGGMLDEINTAADLLRITIHRNFDPASLLPDEEPVVETTRGRSGLQRAGTNVLNPGQSSNRRSVVG